MLTPADYDLPAKFVDFRPKQFEIAAKVANNKKFAAMIDAPPGVGKTLIAGTVQKILENPINYIVTTKQLQDQILDDFPYAKTVKGRNNYPCAKFPRDFPTVTAEMCTHQKNTKNECTVRGRCAYMIAKQKAARAPLAVLNMSYFLAEVNYNPESPFKERSLSVIDEFDTVDDQLMNFIELVITKKQLDKLDIEPPKFKTKFEAWVEWAKQAQIAVSEMVNQLERNAEEEWFTESFADIRRLIVLKRLLSKLRFFVSNVDDSWVWYPGQDRWTFKPVWIDKYAPSNLWNHTSRIIGMSATILDPFQTARNIGLTLGGKEYSYDALPCPFPKENRPIVYRPTANVVNSEMIWALPKIRKEVERIMSDHKDDRILIHTVSYKIKDYLLSNISSNRFITHTTFDRIEVLEKFKASKDPLVLVSPSMDRGVDLPYDTCRVNIIVKVPFGDLGDPQIKKRVYGSKDGNHWYAHKAVSNIIQRAGRIVRAEDDYGITYILDEQFGKLLSQHRNLFPKWFREAIIYE